MPVWGVLGVTREDSGRASRGETVGRCVHAWCVARGRMDRRILLSNADAVVRVVLQKLPHVPHGIVALEPRGLPAEKMSAASVGMCSPVALRSILRGGGLCVDRGVEY